jgi:2,3-bisphosphoglycerate-dependent phosphoglycerate mutase
MTTIFFIRHAENPANVTRQFSNRKIDFSLTAKGILQAQQTADFLSTRGLTHLFSSPLKRARETADIIGAAAGLPVTMIEHLRELNVGDLEGLPPTLELWEQHDDIIRAWRSGKPGERFPGGEDYHELLARAQDAINEILAASTTPTPARIAVVIHGGWLSFTLADLFPGINPQEIIGKGLANCSVTERELEQVGGRSQARLVAWGRHAHLSGEAAELLSGTIRRTDQASAEPAD